jgi:hypothetical protein
VQRGLKPNANMIGFIGMTEQLAEKIRFQEEYAKTYLSG